MSSTATTMSDNIVNRLKNILSKSATTGYDDAGSDALIVEPTSLALRIQSLINNLPPPMAKTIVKNPKPPRLDKNGRPIAPPAPIQDSDLIKILSSASIMNGSTDKNNYRPSIWSILDAMDASKHEDGFPQDSLQTDPQDVEDDIPDIFSDVSSVMVYSPLIPNRDSLVELAEFQVVGQVDRRLSSSIPGWSWGQVLPSVTSWFSQQPGQPITSSLSNDHNSERLQALATSVWIPSKDKLSIECMWWGYRMFLPPPVLDVLNNTELKAVKRAAMITTALTWVFNNLPIDSFPLVLRPTLLLLQRIAPYLGYIGTFISWAWDTIKGYDKGHGVILTATWLLPIALIPGTWSESDCPVASPPSSSVPSPPTGIPTPPPSQSPPPPPPLSPTTPSSQPAMMLSNSPSVPTSSPSPTSPKWLPVDLVSLVTKSPNIRVRRSNPRTDLESTSPTAQFDLGAPVVATNTTSNSFPTIPTSTSPTSPTAPHPNDQQLYQTPSVKASPSSPRLVLHSVSLPDTETAESSKEQKRRKGMRFWK